MIPFLAINSGGTVMTGKQNAPEELFYRFRPKSLSEADLKKARALLHSGDYTKVQVAEDLEVSRHTLWRAMSQATTP